jgi:hypothetical protein
MFVSIAFASGVLGGLINSLAVWIFGIAGISPGLGVKLAPALTPPWLYPRLVWGGIWGLLLVLPIMTKNPVMRGIILSIAPTLVQLFVIFPFLLHKGMMGLQLGNLMPVLVVFFNIIWGITASLWYSYVGDKTSKWNI